MAFQCIYWVIKISIELYKPTRKYFVHVNRFEYEGQCHSIFSYNYWFILQIRSEIVYHGAIKLNDILVGIFISFFYDGIKFNPSSFGITEIIRYILYVLSLSNPTGCIVPIPRFTRNELNPGPSHAWNLLILYLNTWYLVKHRSMMN
jgi:hypothetical protein